MLIRERNLDSYFKIDSELITKQTIEQEVQELADVKQFLDSFDVCQTDTENFEDEKVVDLQFDSEPSTSIKCHDYEPQIPTVHHDLFEKPDTETTDEKIELNVPRDSLTKSKENKFESGHLCISEGFKSLKRPNKVAQLSEKYESHPQSSERFGPDSSSSRSHRKEDVVTMQTVNAKLKAIDKQLKSFGNTHNTKSFDLLPPRVSKPNRSKKHQYKKSAMNNAHKFEKKSSIEDNHSNSIGVPDKFGISRNAKGSVDNRIKSAFSSDFESSSTAQVPKPHHSSVNRGNYHSQNSKYGSVTQTIGSEDSRNGTIPIFDLKENRFEKRNQTKRNSKVSMTELAKSQARCSIQLKPQNESVGSTKRKVRKKRKTKRYLFNMSSNRSNMTSQYASPLRD